MMMNNIINTLYSLLYTKMGVSTDVLNTITVGICIYIGIYTSRVIRGVRSQRSKIKRNLKRDLAIVIASFFIHDFLRVSLHLTAASEKTTAAIFGLFAERTTQVLMERETQLSFVRGVLNILNNITNSIDTKTNKK